MPENRIYAQDTIAAIATPVGRGGIGIIKISGPDAIKIIQPFFRSGSFDPIRPNTHRIYYGKVIDPVDGCELDEVLVSYMQGPTSYTGEDVVEINCHSGLVVLQQLLNLVINSGARPAEPGEFTKRAFLNGRIDLTQAEAVVDVIEAQTDTGLKLAARQMKGALTKKAAEVQQKLLEVTAFLEASIDFPEDDLDDLNPHTMVQKVQHAAETIKNLIATFDEGRLYRAGIQVVIVGKPNVGKSSLLNALVGDTRAIVTAIPGTTRDVIHETISIQGIPVKLLDTAGLHQGNDEIEKIGIDITLSKIPEADLVLLVLDGSSNLDERDWSIIETVRDTSAIIIVNKSDLPQVLSVQKLPNEAYHKNIVKVSALYHHGIDELKKTITHTIIHEKHDITSNILISNARHKNALEKTLASLQIVLKGFQEQLAAELVAVDLQAALSYLGELTGETTTDDILDMIFSRFCIGK